MKIELKNIRLEFRMWQNAHKLQSKVQFLQNTAHRPSTQASYTMGLETTLQENKLAAQIAA